MRPSEAENELWRTLDNGKFSASQIAGWDLRIASEIYSEFSCTDFLQMEPRTRSARE